MMSERERILEMVAAGKITAAEGEELLAAVQPARKRRWAWLFDPFSHMRTAIGLGVAVVVAGGAATLSVCSNIRFDGTLDLHAGPASLTQALIDQALSWVLLALLFWATVRIVTRQSRLVDWLWALGVARWPLVAAAAVSETGLAWTWRLTKLQVGTLRGIEARKVSHRDALTAVDLTCAFSRGKLRVRVVFDDEERVTGFWLRDVKG